MENPLNWLAVSGVLIFILVLVMIQGYGVMRVGWWNLSHLRELKRRQLETEDPVEARALASLIECCEALRKKWVLGEPDLHVFSKTRDLVQEIAGHFHPKSKAPLQEARLGALLNAFLQLKIQVEALAGMRGVRTITQFRLRHIVFFSSAWRKKTECLPTGAAPGSTSRRPLRFLQPPRVVSFVLLGGRHVLVSSLDTLRG